MRIRRSRHIRAGERPAPASLTRKGSEVRFLYRNSRSAPVRPGLLRVWAPRSAASRSTRGRGRLRRTPVSLAHPTHSGASERGAWSLVHLFVAGSIPDDGVAFLGRRGSPGPPARSLPDRGGRV